MPRARNKGQLLEFGKFEFDTLVKHVSKISGDELTKKLVFGNCSVKDIIAHLHTWHKLILTWNKDGMAEKELELPAPGYSSLENRNFPVFLHYPALAKYYKNATINTY